jgi:amidase
MQVDIYLRRIRAIDKGLDLRAILQLNPDAQRIAAQLDRERRQKGPRGPLHGIPILLKDNIDTADSTQTTSQGRSRHDAGRSDPVQSRPRR